MAVINVWIVFFSRADIKAKDNIGWTALMHACKKGHIRCVDHLLVNEIVDVNDRDVNNITPLMLACLNKKVRCVRRVLQSPSIKINLLGNYGWNALIYATENGNINCCNILIKAGIYIGDCDTNGMTALSWAALHGHANLIDFIVKFTRDDDLIAICDKCSKMKPLMLAAWP